MERRLSLFSMASHATTNIPTTLDISLAHAGSALCTTVLRLVYFRIRLAPATGVWEWKSPLTCFFAWALDYFSQAAVFGICLRQSIELILFYFSSSLANQRLGCLQLRALGPCILHFHFHVHKLRDLVYGTKNPFR